MKSTKARIRILPWFLMGLIFLTATGCDWLCPDPEEEEAEASWIKNYTPVMSGTEGSWDESTLIQASVLFIDNVYHMWYGGAIIEGQNVPFAIGHATSPDGFVWTKDPANPVLVKGAEGSFEEHMVYMPYVVKAGNTFHMWYTGRDMQNEHIGYATSPDGVSWTKSASNPVLMPATQTGWEGVDQSTGPVLYRDNKFHMWYNGSNGTEIKVGYATSDDGANWTRHPGNPVLDNGGDGKWDFPRVQAGSVIHNGTGFEMWYGGGEFGSWLIGHATSPDGITWERDADNPVVVVSNEHTGWDITYVGWPTVLQGTGSKLRMWYSSTTYNVFVGGGIGYAEWR